VVLLWLQAWAPAFLQKHALTWVWLAPVAPWSSGLVTHDRSTLGIPMRVVGIGVTSLSETDMTVSTAITGILVNK
jgi:hypothetical protein